MRKGFPGMVRNWVGGDLVSKVDNGILELSWANVGGMVDDGVAARAEVRVLVGPRKIGISVPDVNEWAILVPMCLLGFFGVAKEREGLLVNGILFSFVIIVVIITVNLPHVAGVFEIDVGRRRVVFEPAPFIGVWGNGKWVIVFMCVIVAPWLLLNGSVLLLVILSNGQVNAAPLGVDPLDVGSPYFVEKVLDSSGDLCAVISKVYLVLWRQVVM